jgi:peptidoglycan/xylan/chitin deacetylase (PgdA/CDA1 family)
MCVDPSALKQHLDLMRGWGYEFLTMGEVAARIRSGPPLRAPTVSITFDDGYKDGLTRALPILLAAGVKATFYITSGLAAGCPEVVGSFRELTQYHADFLSASDLRELRSAGMEIGAHTHSHPNLARLCGERLSHEIAASKEWIEETLSAPVEHFAYPFGKRGLHYSDATVQAVRRCGYRAAASVEFRTVRSLGAVDLFRIPRFFVTREDSAATLREKVSGALDWLGWFQATGPRWLKAAISPEDGRV